MKRISIQVEELNMSVRGVDCAAVLRAIVDADNPRRAPLDLLATTPRLGYGSEAA
jgi:hypothetical protein